MYAMQITSGTAEFIGKYFNDGVVPKIEEEKTFFLFGDDAKPNEIVTENTFVMKYDPSVVRHCALFEFE